MNIRIATPKDFTQIDELLDAADVPLGESPADLGGTFIVAEIDGRIVGAVWYIKSDKVAWVGCLAVHPECRRKKLAAMLLATGTEVLRGIGIKTVFFTFRQENIAMENMVQLFGAKTDGPFTQGSVSLQGD
jgi:N-acetylglutamate synthase-like GNAT family acetyltransferase